MSLRSFFFFKNLITVKKFPTGKLFLSNEIHLIKMVHGLIFHFENSKLNKINKNNQLLFSGSVFHHSSIPRNPSLIPYLISTLIVPYPRV